MNPKSLEVALHFVAEKNLYTNVLFIRTPVKVCDDPEVFVWASPQGHIAEGRKGHLPVPMGVVGNSTHIYKGFGPEQKKLDVEGPQAETWIEAWIEAWKWVNKISLLYRGYMVQPR